MPEEPGEGLGEAHIVFLGHLMFVLGLGHVLLVLLLNSSIQYCYSRSRHHTLRDTRSLYTGPGLIYCWPRPSVIFEDIWIG